MAITATKAFFGTGYNEALSSCAKMDTTNPHEKTGYTCGTWNDAYYVATDGTNVYWAGHDPSVNEPSTKVPITNFVWASKVSDDTPHIFQSGAPYQGNHGRNPSVIDLIANSTTGFVSGLAVQKSGTHLFAAHALRDELHVLNKSSGALVRTIAMTQPHSATVDGNDNLWIITGAQGSRVVQKYQVNADGSLTLLSTIAGLSNPLYAAVSPTSNLVVVADGGSSSQLKAFTNTATPMLQWTYGLAGGYANGPDVTNDKFFWQDGSSARSFGTGKWNQERAWIAFQPDGSFWVSDTANNRYMRFDADRVLQDTIMFTPVNYAGGPVANDPTRVLIGMLEFKIDYSKPLSPANGSWTLTKNFAYNLDPKLFPNNREGTLESPVKLSNGKTYAMILDATRSIGENKIVIVELTQNGLRFTGVPASNAHPTYDYAKPWLYEDGTVRANTEPRYYFTTQYGRIGSPTAEGWGKRDLLGFDAAGNPKWSDFKPIATVASPSPDDPNHWGMITVAPISSAGVIGDLTGPVGDNLHGFNWGGLNSATGRWVFRSGPAVNISYQGPFPTDHYMSYSPNYSTGLTFATGRNFFWNFIGEGWQGGQTNVWYHFTDDGLMVGQAGVAMGFTVSESQAMAAGNAYHGGAVIGPDGNYYMYQTDESHHGGLHRWKIEGLNTVAVQKVPITLAAPTPGLIGTYFNSLDLNNVYRAGTRSDAQVNFTWGTGGPRIAGIGTSNYSVRWEGFVSPRYAQTYTFFARSDSGVRVWVDRRLIIDQWNNAASAEYSGAIALKAGKSYPIRIEYKETTGSSQVRLSWSSASQQKQVIPSTSSLVCSIDLVSAKSQRRIAV